MYREISTAFGLGLGVLFIAGLANHAPGWLTWLDGAGALLAFLTAAAASVAPMAGAAVAALLAGGLIILWIVALATGESSAQAWWTLGFALGFFTLAAIAVLGALDRRRQSQRA